MILEKAFEKHKTWVRIVVSFGCNRITAEDIVQEAYIKVDEMTKKGKDLWYKDELNYWYMYKILRHLYLHLKFQEKKIKVVEQKYINKDFDEVLSCEDKLPAASYVDYKMFNDKFEDVLGTLTWYDRSIFEMLSSGKKISELSRETNISYVSLWNSYSKVKKYIKSKIKNYDWFRGFDSEDY